MKVRFLYTICFAAFIMSLFVSCKSSNEESVMIGKKSFGKLSNGEEVFLYTLTNKNGLKAEITNYGAAVVSLIVPNKNGKFEDIVLGYDDAAGYEKGESYFGAIVGRYGNRIGKGKFSLGGKEYQLSMNNGENHLHGGKLGFNKRIWEVVNAEKIMDGSSITLKYVSVDGEEGYPGTVELTVNYFLTKDNELSINYSATSDKNTIMNPTHHSYFNLNGDPNKTILDHELMIDADKFTPVDIGLITTGEMADVTNTPFDFRTPKKIGKDIIADNEQLKFGLGYDHNWVLNKHQELIFKFASVYEQNSGRLMEVWTDQPGVQFYSGNFLDGKGKGKGGVMYQYRTGFCMEAQKFPDSPNKHEWPSATLKASKDLPYRQTTIYKFSTK
ncbi:MAG: aldose epimerase family protein [Ignavibacteria bacterium]|nr:aldose epimerase family protein [Ignavibacteria bacterium]